VKTPILLVVILFSWTFAQTEKAIKPDNPCDHPVIKKAQTEGLNSLSILEIPQFLLATIQCKRHAKKTGEKVDFDSLYKQKNQQNYETSQQLSGIGTCCLVVTALITFYSFVGYMLGAD